MWVQYKQGEVITPQRQSAPQTHSVRYHSPEAMRSNENKQAAPPEAAKTNVFTSVFGKESSKNSSVMQNHFTENIAAKPQFSSKSMLFSDELQAITSPHIAQTGHNESHHFEKCNRLSAKAPAYALAVFACLYLLGAIFSGVLYALLTSTQADYLSYYLSYFMASAEHSSMFSYCINLCCICSISLTAVVLLGLSALGLPLLLLLLFLKGIGSGMLLLQFFAEYQWSGLLYYFISVGIAEVCLTTAICLLACTAANSASALLQTVIQPQKECIPCKTRQLAGHYLMLLFSLLVICLLCAVMFRGFFGDFQLR